MEEKKNELWTGGSWEHPEDPFPTIPPVVIPDRPMEPRRRKKRHKKRKIPWFAMIIAVIFGAALVIAALHGPLIIYLAPPGGAEGSQMEQHMDPPSIEQAETGTGVTITLEPNGGEELTLSALYDSCLPSLVSVHALGEDTYGSGTGIIFTADGYILTNAHVVADAEEVQVVLYDNRDFEARLVGFQRNEDLAVLKIEASGLTPARFGDSNQLRIGEPVAALGDPLGYRATLTHGIISAVDRRTDLVGREMSLIQTDTAINHGNSGGALFNRFGQVVGVTTLKIVSEDGSSESLGFAIPSRRVKYVANQLIAGHQAELALFGFSVKTAPAEGGGLELVEVESASDCFKKGLRPGDIITAVEGTPIRITGDLSRVKLDRAPGEVLSITYRRDGVEQTVEVALMADTTSP